MRKLINAAAVIVAAAVALPTYAARGSADFTRFVALGDSYGAGYESGSLNQNHQIYGWPAVIAKQVGQTICSPSASGETPGSCTPTRKARSGRVSVEIRLEGSAACRGLRRAACPGP